MPTFDLESELLDPVSRFFRHRSFRQQEPEMAFYEYRIDLYAYSVRLSQSVAIELKLRNWTRALEQALLYQLCAELVYLALPETETRLVPHSILEEHGLGLIAVGHKRCRELVRPERSTAYRSDYAEVYREHLMRGS